MLLRPFGHTLHVHIIIYIGCHGYSSYCLCSYGKGLVNFKEMVLKRDEQFIKFLILFIKFLILFIKFLILFIKFLMSCLVFIHFPVLVRVRNLWIIKLIMNIYYLYCPTGAIANSNLLCLPGTFVQNFGNLQ